MRSLGMLKNVLYSEIVGGFGALQYMLDRELQYAKALPPISVMPEPIVMVVRLLQPSNAS